MTSRNAIRKAAAAFSLRWRDAFSEKSQAQSFLKEFFEVFGVDTVRQATFEHPLQKLDGGRGYADMFWPGTLLVEMKSKGEDLDAAFAQARDYVIALPAHKLPKAIVVSDFQTFRFYDCTCDNALTTFRLADLLRYVPLFDLLNGGGPDPIREQDPVNRKAAEKMARLHDALEVSGYHDHELEVYLVRLLFCLFAEDTGIFDPDQFSRFVEHRTAPDGSDLAAKIAELFQVLDTPPTVRLPGRDEALAAFPYVNGGLFREILRIPAFSADMRAALLECGRLDWSKISPAIFGAMFQGVMDKARRHDLGAHYTSEENILKVIRPLFLDRLRDDFNRLRLLAGPSRRNRLEAFHDRLAALRFLDPACGCGNFLLVAYREIRRLEMDLIEELRLDDPNRVLDIDDLCKVDVSQFFGIEIEHFPAEIAKVALWLMDHLCNLELASRFGQYFTRIPIKAAPHILCANALTTDWTTLCPSFDFIFGNPPFLGAMWTSPEQKSDMAQVFGAKQKLLGELDFVTAWFKKASDLIKGTVARCAFVATNSITQGQSVPVLGRALEIEIDFAYRTFKWHNEARGNAAVHCVIIGFHAAEHGGTGVPPVQGKDDKFPSSSGRDARSPKFIYDGGVAIPAKHINGYLMDAPSVLIESRSTPICDVPPMNFGNMPRDGGNLIIEAEDYEAFVQAEPQALPLIHPLLGAEEFLNRKRRYCLWLDGASPALIAKCPLVKERIEKCREMRLASKAASTRKFAATPGLFCQITQPEGKDYIAVPRVSSERREYVPIGFLTAETKVTDLLQIIPDATLYHFGILTSRMHNAWMRAVCGRLELRYRYSKDIVYNNFIWPGCGRAGTIGIAETTGTADVAKSQKSQPSQESQLVIASAAQAILDVRKKYLDADADCTLAILYNPETMPPDLLKAHQHLDALVDKAYGKRFASDAERVAHLFDLYAATVNKGVSLHAGRGT